MKILMISYNQIGQGTYLRIYEFARQLVEMNQYITIMATSAKGHNSIEEWQENGINIVTVPSLFSSGMRYGWDPYSILMRLKWVRSRRFDLVHGFESRPTVIYPAISLQKKGIPLILDWCDWFGSGGSIEERPNSILRFCYRPFETFFENYYRKQPDFTTVICSTLYQRALSFGVNTDRLSLIPNGLNMPEWQNIHKYEAREQYGFNPSDFIIGYVGSLFLKDAILMTNAFELISQQLPNAKLLHLGRSNYSSNENLNITTTGNIDLHDLQIGLSACDICWLPFSDIGANWGRFPLKFSNYLAAGKPVLSTNIGDISNYVNLYEIGEVCEPNAIALSDAVIQMADNPEIIQYYSDNSYELTNNFNHSWHHLGNQLMRIYESIQ